MTSAQLNPKRKLSDLKRNLKFWGDPEEEKSARLFRKMYYIRRFEETLLSLFEEGALNGTTHAYIGQEANAVGIMENLRPDDHVFSNHRCHGHYLAKTGDALGLLAEIMGKKAGICGGLGGSQHICAPGFKSNGIQGGIVPTAAGIALAEKLESTGNISVVFIGEGTLGEGIVYETLNIASLWKLPFFIILENNQWAQSTPLHLNLAGNIASRFSCFAIPAREITSTDVLEIERVAAEEIRQVREEQKPRALIINTYRLCHHSKNDDFRPEEEVKEHWKTEPLMVHEHHISNTVKEKIKQEIDRSLKDLVEVVRTLE